MMKIVLVLGIGIVIFLLTCLASKNIKKSFIFGGMAAMLAFVGPYIVEKVGDKRGEELIVQEDNNIVYDEGALDVHEDETKDVSKVQSEEVIDNSEENDAVVEEDLTCVTFIGETHNPSDVSNQVSVTDWIQNEDYDIASKTYAGGVKITIYNMFSAMDGNDSGILTEIVSESHFALDTEKIESMKEDQHFTGKFVIGKETDSSPSTAVISILLDGEEVYNSGEVNCYSLDIPSFDILLVGKKEMVIKIICQHKGNPFVIGLV